MNVTKEEENFCHLGFGIVNTCTTILRDILQSYVLPGDIANKVASILPVSGKLNQQQQILITRASTDGYNNFDISLTYFLLRNVCTRLMDPQKVDLLPPTRGWGKAPQAKNISMADDIERIRILRNEMYGHLPKAAIPTPQFNQIWSDLQDISQRMQVIVGKDYPTSLSSILSKRLTNDGWKELKDLISQNEERDKRLKDQIQQLQADIIEQKASEEEQQRSNSMRLRTHSAKIKELQDNQNSYPSKRNEGLKLDPLRTKMLEINSRETRDIFLSYSKRSKQLPVESVFVPLILKEDFVPVKNVKDFQTPFSPRYGKGIKNPLELFFENGKLARYVFLTGLAAHGKSVYCLWLISQWCMAQISRENDRKLCEVERGLIDFDFVFFVRLRDVDRSRKTVENMICHDVYMNDGDLHETIRQVLCSEQYRCMIILDGLDEWRPNANVVKQLACKGMPTVENVSQSVFVIATRPSKLEEVKGILRECDRVFEIQGISSNGMEKLIDNVICNCYGVNKSDAEYELKLNEIKIKSRNSKLKSLLTIPLFAILFVQISYEQKAKGKSTTLLIGEMLDILIRKSSEKHGFCLQTISNRDNYCVPSSHLTSSDLKEKDNLMNFIHAVPSLTEFALDCILSQTDTKILTERTLMEQLGKETLILALDSGLITYGIESRGDNEGTVCIYFLHKTIQEFLSAICILTSEQKIYFFPRILSGVTKIRELYFVVLFICGMNRSLGGALSERIANTIYIDPDVSESRENTPTLYKHLLEPLYQLETDLHTEFKCCREMSDDLYSTCQFYVSNIYVDFESDNETVSKTTHELLSNSNVNILSLQLYRVPTEGHVGIQNGQLINFLNCTRSLRSLYINGWNTERSIENIAISNLRICLLYHITIENNDLCMIHGSSAVPCFKNLPKLQRLELRNFEIRSRFHVSNSCSTTPFISNLPQLQQLTLKNITVHKSNSNIGVTSETCPLFSNMPHLQKIILDHVTISQESSEVLFERGRDISTMLPNVPDTLPFHRTPSSCSYSQITINTPLLLNTPNLQKLLLEDITLTDVPLGITFSMSELTEIGLYCVIMSDTGWSNFLKSLSKVQHEFKVALDSSNIDKKSFRKINSSPEFVVLCGSNRQRIDFKRKRTVKKESI